MQKYQETEALYLLSHRVLVKLFIIHVCVLAGKYKLNISLNFMPRIRGSNPGGIWQIVRFVSLEIPYFGISNFISVH